MRKKLRMISLVMFLIGAAFVVLAFLTMDVPIDYPAWLFHLLKAIYRIYPVVMILLFVISFIVKDR